jgi:hypothetical protein
LSKAKGQRHKSAQDRKDSQVSSTVLGWLKNAFKVALTLRFEILGVVLVTWLLAEDGILDRKYVNLYRVAFVIVVGVLFISPWLYRFIAERNRYDEANESVDGPTDQDTRLLPQLSNAISLRSGQDQVLWSIFGAFWATNAILLIALFTPASIEAGDLVGVVIPITGIFVSFVWATIQNRALGHLDRYERLILRLEQELKFTPAHAVSAGLNSQEYNKSGLNDGLHARQLMSLCSRIAEIFWFLVLFYFLSGRTI